MTSTLVGVDSFAYHRWFGEWNQWESPIDTKWDTFDFLRRARELRCDIVSLQTCYLGEMRPETMGRVSAEASDLNLDLVLAWGHRDGLRGGTSEERFRGAMRAIDVGSEMGVGLVRVVCGDQTFYPIPAAMRTEALVPRLAALARRAGDLGMAIAVENHADFTTDEMVGLVTAVGEPNLGICFDFGNSVRVGDDPLEAARAAASHALMVHVKDLCVQDDSIGDPGAWWPTTPLGQGDLPVAQMLAELGASRAGPPLFVEMANMHPSFPDEDTSVATSIDLLRGLLAS